MFGRFSKITEGFSSLNIYVNKCKNNTASNKTCFSSDTIERKLSNVYFSHCYLDYEIDHNNSTQVYKQVTKSSNLLMSSTIHKKYYYYFRVIYNTDYGFIFQDNHKETFYQQDNYQVEDKLPDSNDISDIGTFSIMNENKVDFYYRSYDKVQNIIANIGGVVQGIMLSASIINYLLVRNYSSLQIVNSIFDYEGVSEENHNNILNFSHYKFVTNVSNANKFNISSTANINTAGKEIIHISNEKDKIIKHAISNNQNAISNNNNYDAENKMGFILTTLNTQQRYKHLLNLFRNLKNKYAGSSNEEINKDKSNNDISVPHNNILIKR